MNHRPKRSLGQNFLRDEHVVARIVNTLDLAEGEHVIEIGPGQGALTTPLLATGASVTVIEFDRDLAQTLRREFGDGLRVIEADALDVDFHAVVPDPPAKLVANLPYNISTPILQRLIVHRELFSCLVLMFQREVVERITAKPGKSDRGYLSVLTEMAFNIEYLFDVPPEAFYPVPKVWSAVIRLSPKPIHPNEEKLREVASRAFVHKRKTLANNLSPIYPSVLAAIRSVELADKCRAEELSLTDWGSLIDRL